MARGQIPFDPVSLFLLYGWQVSNKWNRAETLKNLRDPRYADLVASFGFANGVYPSEGGLRYFLTRLEQNSPDQDNTVVVDEATDQMMARQRLNELIANRYTCYGTPVSSPLRRGKRPRPVVSVAEPFVLIGCSMMPLQPCPGRRFPTRQCPGSAPRGSLLQAVVRLVSFLKCRRCFWRCRLNCLRRLNCIAFGGRA